MPDRVIFWFRRDLRLVDNPALAAAAAAGPVLGCFVVDPVLAGPAGPPRRRFLADSLADLGRALGGRLCLTAGEPAAALGRLAAGVGAGRIYATADYGPYGTRRDRHVAAELAGAGITVSFVDSPYAVAPGTVLTNAGHPFQVFTPFHKAWLAAGWADPIDIPDLTWLDPPPGTAGCDPAALLAASRPGHDAGHALATSTDGNEPPAPARQLALDLAAPAHPGPTPAADRAPSPGADGWAAGEEAAHQRLAAFLAGPVDDYAAGRDDPGIDGTSGLSTYLKYGTLHPRQILALLDDRPGPAAVARELAWREFHADVLWHRPDSAHTELQARMTNLAYDHGPQADKRFQAWAGGRTGYPIVDAGMRQLAATGWMHNRVRMIVASFLVKDLHLDWRRGARWFMEHLVDGDLASNQHNWQWVAGTGTDAAPYFRIFNPVTQAERFDPGGRYVRTWVPELADLPDKFVQRPWTAPGGPPAGYPGPLVDHAEERRESLRRFDEVRQNSAHPAMH